MQVVAAICAGVGAYIVGDWLQLPSKPFMNKSVSVRNLIQCISVVTSHSVSSRFGLQEVLSATSSSLLR